MFSLLCTDVSLVLIVPSHSQNQISIFLKEGKLYSLYHDFTHNTCDLNLDYSFFKSPKGVDINKTAKSLQDYVQHTWSKGRFPWFNDMALIAWAIFHSSDLQTGGVSLQTSWCYIHSNCTIQSGWALLEVPQSRKLISKNKTLQWSFRPGNVSITL